MSTVALTVRCRLGARLADAHFGFGWAPCHAVEGHWATGTGHWGGDSTERGIAVLTGWRCGAGAEGDTEGREQREPWGLQAPAPITGGA